MWPNPHVAVYSQLYHGPSQKCRSAQDEILPEFGSGSQLCDAGLLTIDSDRLHL